MAHDPYGHVLADGAEDLLAPLVLAMQARVPASTLADLLLPYPCMAEALRLAARQRRQMADGSARGAPEGEKTILLPASRWEGQDHLPAGLKVPALAYKGWYSKTKEMPCRSAILWQGGRGDFPGSVLSNACVMRDPVIIFGLFSMLFF